MDAKADAIHLKSQDHSVYRLLSGARRVAIEASWKQICTGELREEHRHHIISAHVYDYKNCPKILDCCECWVRSAIEPSYIYNAGGEQECFYCALSREAPDVKFTEIQQVYLDAHFEQDDFSDSRWQQGTQRFFEEHAFTSRVKPAKQQGRYS